MVLQKTGDKPKEVIFVDDKKEYVKTAKDLEMNSIHYKNTKQLKKEINKLIFKNARK